MNKTVNNKFENMTNMDRRTFIKNSIYASLAAMGSTLYPNISEISANELTGVFPDNNKHALVNLVLDGGPDFRHLFVPKFDSNNESYGFNYWTHRYRSHYLNQPTAENFNERWTNNYSQINYGSLSFGILNKAGWLKSQFEMGNVAIINNVITATNRNHAHALVMLESGDFDAGPHDLTRDGWGGRLATYGETNVISLTNQVRMFCHGPHPTNPRLNNNDRVISARDTRQIALAYPDALFENIASTNSKAILTRALRSYYDGIRNVVSKSSPYYKIVDQEKALRNLGDRIMARLNSIEEPSEITLLYEGEDSNKLNSSYFGKQCRNVYDAFACSDILNFRIASMEYPLWDSHKKQVDWIEPKIEDIFGQGKGFDVLFQQIQQDMPDLYENLVIVVSGEFGRQLAANGDRGTDHGEGNSMLIIGKPVNGGVYGELFPQSEIQRDSLGRTKYDIANTDIQGLTSMERVFGVLCDWIQPGTGDMVFPNRQNSLVEPGVNLSFI